MTIRCYMDEIEVINILRQYNDKTDRENDKIISVIEKIISVIKCCHLITFCPFLD